MDRIKVPVTILNHHSLVMLRHTNNSVRVRLNNHSLDLNKYFIRLQDLYDYTYNNKLMVNIVDKKHNTLKSYVDFLCESPGFSESSIHPSLLLTDFLALLLHHLTFSFACVIITTAPRHHLTTISYCWSYEPAVATVI